MCDSHVAHDKVAGAGPELTEQLQLVDGRHMSSKKISMGVLAGVTTALLTAPAAQAVTTLFDSNGFEATGSVYTNPSTGMTNPVANGYSAGVTSNGLAGQSATATQSQQFSGLLNGSTTNFPVAGVGQYTGSTQQFVALSATNVPTNTNAEYFPNANSPARGGTLYQPLGANASTGSIVDITFNMAVSSAATTGDPEIGVVARDGNGAEVSSLLVDVPSDFIAGTTFKPTLGTGNFYSYLLRLDYGAKTASIFAYVAGSATSFNASNLVTTKPFTTPAATSFQYAALTEFSGGGTVAYTGNARFDNYTVTASPVPEPTTVSVLIGGAAMAMGRRRRSR